MRQDIGFTCRHSRVRGNPVFSRENGNPENQIPACAGIKNWIPAVRRNDEMSLTQSDKTFGNCYKDVKTSRRIASFAHNRLDRETVKMGLSM